ncbi:insulin-like growth factor-binding protein 3 isoform X2 [Poeciliopsis prolifica]|uniref:insulin-like growth factor-binding protein 3 isoform X2 n=1 Tax=Poeciliopsis prolifica TaxID=188132 RepID=UPI002413519D|nr:insulin-like growth factor-binding protein 3 isoform X2 [Poeciliopsis prolifica]
MDSHFLALRMIFLVASLTRRSGASGPVIRCEPCDARARLLCKPLPRECAERVREPGCGCCMTCALSFGQPCGVYTGRCSSGLTCQHQPDDTEVKDKEEKPSTPDLETLCNPAPPRPSLHPILSSAKSNAIRWDKQKATQIFKVEDLSGPVITDQLNISLETKQEPEYGPCRREIERMLSTLKIINILNPRGFRIPNCDKKGFYKKKQCHPSKGRKRGFCWSVDKYGQPLPGLDGKEREVQRYNSESQ